MKKVLCLFPGQGSQFIGMGKKLCLEYDYVRDIYKNVDEILKMNLSELCFNGDLNELSKTYNAQLAIFVLGYAMYQVYKKEVKLTPEYFAGHSIGEITALVCAGAFRFEDALLLVRERGKFMQETVFLQNAGMTAVIGADIDMVADVCSSITTESGNFIGISNYNSLEQIVISGNAENLEKAEKILKEKKVRIVRLKVNCACHSPYMYPAAEKLAVELDKYSFHKFHGKVISNVTGMPYVNPDEIKRRLTIQLTEPVRWDRAMNYLSGQGIDGVFEMGEKEILTNIARNYFDSKYIFSSDIRGLKNAAELVENPGRQECYLNFIQRCLGTAVAVKNDGNKEDYDKISDEYNKIIALTKVEELQDKDVKDAEKKLVAILKYKNANPSEIRDRIEEMKDLSKISLYISDGEPDIYF